MKSLKMIRLPRMTNTTGDGVEEAVDGWQQMRGCVCASQGEGGGGRLGVEHTKEEACPWTEGPVSVHELQVDRSAHEREEHPVAEHRKGRCERLNETRRCECVRLQATRQQRRRTRR